MSVSCCLFVDRSSQIQHLDDSCRTEIKVLTKDLNQFCIRKFSCSECINCDRCRLCNTDCIRKLNLTFLSKSCCYNILCCITCCISCRTVYLCTVLSGESTATVTSHSAVSINDDLTSCQSTVSVWSTDHETSCRVYEELCLFVYEFCRNDLIEYIFLNILMNLLLSHIRVMLCRKNNCIQTLYRTVFVVLYCNLCLSIRTKVSKCSVFTNLCQLTCKLMSHCNRVRHILFCLIRSITEHHTLVSCSDRLDVFI